LTSDLRESAAATARCGGSEVSLPCEVLRTGIAAMHGSREHEAGEAGEGACIGDLRRSVVRDDDAVA
jgi:hypothetical protein